MMANIEIPKGSLFGKLWLLFIAVGIAALIYWSTIFQLDRSRAMYSYLFAFIAVLTLGLGSLIFVMIQHITRAGWSVVIRRLPETVISLMPIFILFFIPIAMFMDEIFPWTHAEHIDAILAKKKGYLEENFFLIRSFGYLIVWSVMGLWFYRTSIRQDAGGKFEITRINQAVSAPGIVVFALSLTFAAFDWVMSLQPHWYSTIFGVYIFAGSFLFGIAFMTLMAMLLQSMGLLENTITSQHYHDLGKLLFGWTIFFAYIAFSQFMLYWYAAIPEEIEYYTHRMHNGWDVMTWAMPIVCFFIPFFGLMSRTLKKVKLILTINCLWVIAAHLFNLYWVIMPAYQASHEPMHLNIALVDVLAFLGIFSMFFGAFLLMLGQNKLAAVGDPRLHESLAFENF